MVFFFEMRKRTKKRGGLRFPPHHPKRPLAKQGVGSTQTTKKRVLLKLGAKLFLFILVLVKHKRKTMSSASEFENACSQTLDIVLLFMQVD